MNQEVSDLLFRSFKKHSQIPSPEEGIFMPMLHEASILTRTCTYPLPEKYQLVEEDGRYSHLSLRRVIATKVFCKEYLPKRNLLKRMSEGLSYSSDSLLENLAESVELSDMIRNAECHFALLGKLKTYDFSNPNAVMFHISRPVLVIPGKENNEKVLAWEENHTRYERESGVLPMFPVIIPVSKEKYEKVSGA